MAEENKKAKASHNIILKSRNNLNLSGIVDVGSFDEYEVVVYTDLGELTIKGSGLHINKINLEYGDLILDGKIDSMIYSEGSVQKNQGFFSKLFK